MEERSSDSKSLKNDPFVENVDQRSSSNVIGIDINIDLNSNNSNPFEL